MLGEVEDRQSETSRTRFQTPPLTGSKTRPQGLGAFQMSEEEY